MFEVYIHVPFCMRRCGYCDFNTYTAIDMGAGASRGNYANMVIREMAIAQEAFIAALSTGDAGNDRDTKDKIRAAQKTEG